MNQRNRRPRPVPPGTRAARDPRSSKRAGGLARRSLFLSFVPVFLPFLPKRKSVSPSRAPRGPPGGIPGAPDASPGRPPALFLFSVFFAGGRANARGVPAAFDLSDRHPRPRALSRPRTPRKTFLFRPPAFFPRPSSSRGPCSCFPGAPFPTLPPFVPSRFPGFAPAAPGLFQRPLGGLGRLVRFPPLSRGGSGVSSGKTAKAGGDAGNPPNPVPAAAGPPRTLANASGGSRRPRPGASPVRKRAPPPPKGSVRGSVPRTFRPGPFVRAFRRVPWIPAPRPGRPSSPRHREFPP
jgi:hypothetical protein